MVSKTLVCLVLLAVVAVCSCKPHEYGDKITMKVEKQRRNFQQDQNQKIDCSNSDSSSDSNESNQQPCELTNQKQQKNKKNLQVQDSSSSESDELDGKKVKILMSQEDNNNSKEIRHAPKHERINQGHSGSEYMRGQQQRENIQKSRKGNGDANSNENNSQGQQNQINRRH